MYYKFSTASGAHGRVFSFIGTFLFIYFPFVPFSAFTSSPGQCACVWWHEENQTKHKVAFLIFRSTTSDGVMGFSFRRGKKSNCFRTQLPKLPIVIDLFTRLPVRSLAQGCWSLALGTSIQISIALMPR